MNTKTYEAYFRTRMNGSLDDIFKTITASSMAEAKRVAKSLEGREDTKWFKDIREVKND